MKCKICSEIVRRYDFKCYVIGNVGKGIRILVIIPKKYAMMEEI